MLFFFKKKVIFLKKCVVLTCNKLNFVFNKLVNIFTVNVERYNPHEQKLFGVLNTHLKCKIFPKPKCLRIATLMLYNSFIIYNFQ